MERESWDIHADAGRVEGQYQRSVVFLSSDGRPFECNQTLSYEQHTTYRFRGSYSGRTLEIAEVSYEAAPSPCDDGHRALATYNGALQSGQLVLRWPDGEQALVRAASGSKTPGPAGSDPDRSLDGSWRWQSRTDHRGEIRVEQEEWELTESPGGQLTGTVLRTVTVFDATGRRFECSDATFYRYRDRYTVNGRRTGGVFTVHETAVAPEPSACLDRQERHLDAATGAALGDYLVLTWRGNRRQVLHRPVD